MDIQFILEKYRDMIRSARNISSLDFDLSPAVVEGVLELGVYDQIWWFFLKKSRFVAENLLSFHNFFDIMQLFNNKIYRIA